VKKTFVIAEIGINHNGSIDIAKQLIDGAVKAECDAVKFQKRTIEEVYSKEELDRPRESPWGITNREQKYRLEFGKAEYDEIDRYCREKNIDWFASAWDIKSQKFLQQYNLKYNKVASAMLTDIELLEEIAKEGKYTFISTGGSTVAEIEDAMNVFIDYKCEFELMHCNSEYPMKNENANLRVITYLKQKYFHNIGFSDHSTGRIVSLAAVALGATSIERHITLDRSLFGSDQSSSIEIEELCKLVKDIRVIEKALGNGIKVVTEKEKEIMKKLRRVK
jgi:N-acetylneuraminate synthase